MVDCQARGLTKHTIETYRSCVLDFLHYHHDPAAVKLEDLRSYLGTLRIRNLQGSTLKGYFAAISTLYDYLFYYGAIDANPIPSFRKRYLSRIKEQYNGENTRQLISIQSMQLLVSRADHIRDLALVLSYAKTGMRKSENLDLEIDDINTRTGEFIIPPKAKRSNRRAFMDEELRTVMERYLSWREDHARCDWLWISDAGGHLHKDMPNVILARLAAPLGLHDPCGPLCHRFTTHCCRHFFTTHLRRAGMDKEFIKWLRGDSLSKEAWEIYNHIDPEDVRQEYLRCTPGLLGQSKLVCSSGFKLTSEPRKLRK